MYGDMIRKVRKAFGLTQAQLAASAGIATNSLQRYETDKRQPTLDTLAAIANALNTPVGELLSGREGPYSVYDNQARFNEVLPYLKSSGFKIRESDGEFDFGKWHLENVEHGIDLVIQEEELVKTLLQIHSEAEARKKLYIKNRLIAEFS